MTNVERTIHIEAPAADVWRVIKDVERWPEWTASVHRLKRLDNGEFGVDGSARIRLRGVLGSSLWRVTSYDDGRAFVWESRAPGLTSTGNHIVEPDGAGSRVTLTVTQRGIGTVLLGPLLARITRENVRTEIEGLKRRCEAAA